jgi:Ni,Fe-hydrogenase I small subunit
MLVAMKQASGSVNEIFWSGASCTCCSISFSSAKHARIAAILSLSRATFSLAL